MIPVSGPKETDPISLVIYGEPKQGKSAIMADLTLNANAVCLSIEPNGYDYLTAKRLEFSKPSELVKQLEEWKINPPGIEIGILDTLTKLDEWAEIMGTYSYMSTTQGKKFNVDEKGKKLTHLDPDWESVHNIGNGYGYRYSREWLLKVTDLMSQVFPKVIFIAHVKDKYLGVVGDNFITTTEIDLTGKLKRTLPSRVSGIAKFKREKDKGMLLFESNEAALGNRCIRLSNATVLISEKDLTQPNGIKTYWENIYQSLTKEK